MNNLSKWALFAFILSFSYLLEAKTVYVRGDLPPPNGSMENRFTSIAQAYDYVGIDNNAAGIYYFDLGGQQFSTQVDNNGYVLAISGNGTGATSYGETSTLTLQSDKILTEAAFAKFDVGEVRINSPASKLGNFDMSSINSYIIDELKAYRPLPNNWKVGAATWTGTHYANMSGATSSDRDQGAYATLKLSHNVIGHYGDGTNGFHWQINREQLETVTYATKTPRDKLNLWVRNTSDNANGTAGKRFNSLAQAYVYVAVKGNAAGTYYFNIAGQQFSTYVDSSGYVLTASANGSSAGAYTTTSALTLQSDKLLTSAAVGQMDIGEVRINVATGADAGFNVITSDSRIISDLRRYKRLRNSKDLGGTNVWGGVTNMNADNSNNDCKTPEVALNTKIYHSACNGGNGMHWIPSDGLEMASYASSNTNLNLWVRNTSTASVAAAAAVNCGDSWANACSNLADAVTIAVDDDSSL
ncbi:MAG: hypothetical protein HRU20_29935, partial [Pseudomonadales bacterium]|nr:hypothetical protein [Pseudomonadales bacterium]